MRFTLALVGLVLPMVLPASTTSVLYSYNVPGEAVVTSGDDESVASYDGEFHFYGEEYSSLHINVNGPISFDEPMDDWSPTQMPLDTPYLTAFWDDIEMYHDAAIYHRQTTEDAVMAKAADDLAAAGFFNTIEYLIIITWNQVQWWGPFVSDPQNTFQVVLVICSNDTMFSIFNYENVDWEKGAVAAFNKGNEEDIYNLQSPGPFSGNLLSATGWTNVGIEGRVVSQIDSDFINVVPGMFTCTSTTNGTVTMFDSLQDQMTGHGKITFTRTIGILSNPCKFGVRANVDHKGDINWVVINVGVHSNPRKHRRSFSFNKVRGKVQERGEGVKARIVSMPYTWDDGNTMVNITGSSAGWTLEGVNCNYSFYFGPDGDEEVLVANVGQPEGGLTVEDGACGPIIM